MKTCNKCGANLPENAKFCQKCGTPVVEPEVAATPAETENVPPELPVVPLDDTPVETSAKPEAAKPEPTRAEAYAEAKKELGTAEQKPAKSDASSFNRIFWQLFVLFGVGTLLLLNLAGASHYSFFRVLWAIFGVLTAIATCVFGIIRFVTYRGEDKENHTQKRSACYTICMALGIMIAVYALLFVIV